MSGAIGVRVRDETLRLVEEIARRWGLVALNGRPMLSATMSRLVEIGARIVAAGLDRCPTGKRLVVKVTFECEEGGDGDAGGEATR